jgi:hypothetical protein
MCAIDDDPVVLLDCAATCEHSVFIIGSMNIGTIGVAVAGMKSP